jgi:hypothetical protein
MSSQETINRPQKEIYSFEGASDTIAELKILQIKKGDIF